MFGSEHSEREQEKTAGKKERKVLNRYRRRGLVEKKKDGGELSKPGWGGVSKVCQNILNPSDFSAWNIHHCI